jgi:hypothetical protein
MKEKQKKYQNATSNIKKLLDDLDSTNRDIDKKIFGYKLLLEDLDRLNNSYIKNMYSILKNLDH